MEQPKNSQLTTNQTILRKRKELKRQEALLKKTEFKEFLIFLDLLETVSTRKISNFQQTNNKLQPSQKFKY